MTMKKPLITLVLAVAAAPLAGCISFGAKPPPSLMTLTATSAPAAGSQQNSASAKSIVIQVPVTPASIATPNVPVQATPTTIAYVKEAVWAEPPARLFARLLADTVSARSGMVVLSTVQSIGDPSASLAGELRTFGLDATSREAVVVYDAALTRSGATTVEKHRFEARVPVAAIDAASAGPALNQAANQVASEVSDWVAAR